MASCLIFAISGLEIMRDMSCQTLRLATKIPYYQIDVPPRFRTRPANLQADLHHCCGFPSDSAKLVVLPFTIS